VVPLVYEWIAERWEAFSENFNPWQDTLDILVVAWVVYWLLMRIKGTRAAQMALGLLILVLAWRLADLLELATVSFLLDNFLSSGLLILIVIFQADIRRALTRVGRGLFASARTQEAHTIEEIVRACQALAQRRVGALIAIERDVQIDEFVEQGTPLDAELSRDLVISLFLPYSPLHDGAAIVRRDRIASAGCILPLAMRGDLAQALGTRHRAAIGITEETDALVVVVSEETGKVSLVIGGEIHEDLDGPHLRQALLEATGGTREPEPEAPGSTEAAESARDSARAAET
jgi:diadenylate cyclase